LMQQVSPPPNRASNQAHRAVVLHSGGLDSSVCLLLALEDGREVVSVGFDYGQQSRVELEYAHLQCRERGIQRRIIRFEWDKPARNLAQGRTLQDIATGGVSPAFLPGRNAVFLALGCAEAAGISAEEVWIGVNAIDYSGYPDCTPEFVDSFQLMVRQAMPTAPAIVAPLIRLSKPEIAKEARRLGLSRAETWSCYRPQMSKAGIKRCQSCDACTLSDLAWGGPLEY